MSSLELRIRRPLKQPTEADWQAWTSEAKVIADTCKNSGLQDKTIAIEVGVDNAVLSKVQTGQARLSEQHMDALMDACGSEAWLHYWILKRGYDPRSLRRIESDIERENRELRERLEAIEAEREVELRLYSKLRTA
jgi:transcriptional regulator with XRE-family HTH domain